MQGNQSRMSFLSRLGFATPYALLDGLKIAAAMRTWPCSASAGPGGVLNLRRYATREELLERLRQAKAHDLQQENPVHKPMWEDRRTYLMLFSLVGASCWAYRFVGSSTVFGSETWEVNGQGVILLLTGSVQTGGQCSEAWGVVLWRGGPPTWPTGSSLQCLTTRN